MKIIKCPTDMWGISSEVHMLPKPGSVHQRTVGTNSVRQVRFKSVDIENNIPCLLWEVISKKSRPFLDPLFCPFQKVASSSYYHLPRIPPVMSFLCHIPPPQHDFCSKIPSGFITLILLTFSLPFDTLT